MQVLAEKEEKHRNTKKRYKRYEIIKGNKLEIQKDFIKFLGKEFN